MTSALADYQLWTDVKELPQSVSMAAACAEGHRLAKWLRTLRPSRLIVSGGGSAHHVAHAAAMAALESKATGCEVIALPSGLLLEPGIGWRPDDVLLAVSASGESRDLLDALDRPGRPRVGVLTASPTSSLTNIASEVFIAPYVTQRGFTHTQVFCSELFVLLEAWASLSGDDHLARALCGLPDALGHTVDAANRWFECALRPGPVPDAIIAFGSGGGWTAAMQTGLLVKEIAGVVCVGLETSEAADPVIMLGPSGLAVSIRCAESSADDRVCNLAAASGARVVNFPGLDHGDSRLLPISSLPATIALAIDLGTKLKREIDSPRWVSAYEAGMRHQRSP